MKPDAPHAFYGAKCAKRLKSWLSRILMTKINDNGYSWTIGSHFFTPIDACHIYNQVDFTELELLIIYNGWRIIALGNEASKKLKKAGLPHFKMPHPSGLNRQVNDKKFIAKKIKECKTWLKE